MVGELTPLKQLQWVHDRCMRFQVGIKHESYEIPPNKPLFKTKARGHHSFHYLHISWQKKRESTGSNTGILGSDNS